MHVSAGMVTLLHTHNMALTWCMLQIHKHEYGISPNRDPSAKSELIIPEESQRLISSSLRGTIHGLSTPTSANYVYQESFKLQLVYNEIDNFTTANTFPFKMVVFEILSVKWLSCLPTLESGECKYLYFTLVEGSHQERCREDTTM